ncbi:TPA: hypothetical protein PFE14_004268 [Kluyvera ascorbata]|nr:hypothetical protein [Kluyvera ascorbata]
MNDITALALIAKIKKQTESFDTVVLKEVETKALVEALEKAQKLATQQGNNACALFDEVVAQRQRIAELESRTVTVKLPERYDVETYPLQSPKGEWYSRDDVLATLAAAGIQVIEGEGQ